MRARWDPIIQGHGWACLVEGNGGMALQILYSTPPPEPLIDDGAGDLCTTTRTDDQEGEHEWKYDRVECMKDSGDSRRLNNEVACEALHTPCTSTLRLRQMCIDSSKLQLT